LKNMRFESRRRALFIGALSWAPSWVPFASSFNAVGAATGAATLSSRRRVRVARDRVQDAFVLLVIFGQIGRGTPHTVPPTLRRRRNSCEAFNLVEHVQPGGAGERFELRAKDSAATSQATCREQGIVVDVAGVVRLLEIRQVAAQPSLFGGGVKLKSRRRARST